VCNSIFAINVSDPKVRIDCFCGALRVSSTVYSFGNLPSLKRPLLLLAGRVQFVLARFECGFQEAGRDLVHRDASVIVMRRFLLWRELPTESPIVSWEHGTHGLPSWSLLLRVRC